MRNDGIHFAAELASDLLMIMIMMRIAMLVIITMTDMLMNNNDRTMSY